MNERETHNFVSVDSFSQLPFIRRETKPPIRLFGFNFPSDANNGSSATADHPPIAAAGGATGVEGRKFECHYCCRKFPTSQALGGHQNAHKRERQHAKRAHLTSTPVSYHRLALPLAPTSRFPFNDVHPPPQFYPSWNLMAPTGLLNYAGLGSATRPINGSPLPDMWRIPPPLPPPVAAVEGVGFSASFSSSSSSSASPKQRKNRVYELKDGVSLDLHL